MKNEEKIKKYLLKYTSVLFFVTSIFFLLTSHALAATLSINTASSVYSVGDNFSVFVVVNSPDQSLNAVDGTVSFPADKLQVSSISKEGSIINLWAEEPNFSNTDGQVSLSGIVLNPGFSGSLGKVLKINFKVEKTGNAAIVFSSGSVLANDGMGTNILTDLNSAQLTLVNHQASTTTTQKISSSQPVTPVKLPDDGQMIPVVYSSTHPDPTKWYSVNDALFNWSLPSGVIGLRIEVDHNQSGAPVDPA